jgi:hypothetical protein
MSVHIDHPTHVTALLISGTWVGVDQGSLHRHQPRAGTSGTTELVYEWTHGGFTYLTLGADIKAVQMRPSTGSG